MNVWIYGFAMSFQATNALPCNTCEQREARMANFWIVSQISLMF